MSYDLPISEVRDELRTDSRLLAPVFDYRHRVIRERIDQYMERFQRFGRLPEIQDTVETKGGPQQQRHYLLNEDQCYFLLTLMQNNDRVVDGKEKLVHAFREARNNVANRDVARADGKQVRRLETDAIQQLVEYASAQGSQHAENYYTNITKMTNRILGLEPGQRDSLGSDTLQQIKVVETVVGLAIREAIAAEMEYREVYQVAKTRAQALMPALMGSEQ